MVLPFIKVFSLVVRVFSKPLINYTKQMHLKNDGFSHPYMRSVFIKMGNRYNRWQTMINRKFMNVQTQFAYRQLADNIALEKGIQFFYQIVFYLIVIGLPAYQLYKGSKESKQKSKALTQRINSIEQKISEVCQNIPKIEKLIEEGQKIHHKIEDFPTLYGPIRLKMANHQKHIYHLQYLL